MTASSFVDSTTNTTNTSVTHSTSPSPIQSMSQSYRLIVRQQPEKARLCSFKEKVDRRPLDPPPIVQLLTDKSNIQYPYFFLYATLVTETGDKDLTFIENARTTAGTTVQSLHRLRDCNNDDGAFFIFADVSIRMEGFFRLRFTLFEIIESYATCRCSVLSDAFQVYSPKSFPGMSESTFLTRSFSEQGVRIRIRKETRTNLLHPNKRRKSDGNHEQATTSAITTTPTRHQSLPTIKSTHSIMSMKNILISPVREATTSHHQQQSPSPSPSSPSTRVLPYPNPTVFHQHQHHHHNQQPPRPPSPTPPAHPHQSAGNHDSTKNTSYTPSNSTIQFTTQTSS